MDGYELCHEIRKKSEWVDMPIVAISTHYDSNYIVKALRHGADDYIPKPVSIETAKKVLNRILTPTVPGECHEQNR
jgi:DNA-binding response OmpR family regulator